MLIYERTTSKQTENVQHTEEQVVIQVLLLVQTAGLHGVMLMIRGD